MSKRSPRRSLSLFLSIALVMQFVSAAFVQPAQAIDSTSIKVYHPDFSARVAAKILATVTTPGASRLRLTLTNTAGYNATLADVVAPTSADAYVAKIDFRNLSAGTYTLTSDVLDTNGTVIAEKVETFTHAINGAPKVGFDENNAMLKDGALTFPLLVWYGQFPGMTTDAAANRLTGGEVEAYNASGYSASSFASYLDQCAANGVVGVGPTRGTQTASTIPSYVNASKGKAALLSWMWMDEPDGANVSAATVRSWTDASHANDPNHPVEMNLMGPPFVGQGVQANTPQSYTKDLVDAQKPAAADWLSTDYYPVLFGAKGYSGMSYQAAFDNFRQHILNLRSWTKDLYPVKTFIELASQPDFGGNVVPTPAQVQAECWIATIAGCRALSWYPFSAGIDPGTPAIQAKVGTALKTFTPQLAQPNSGKVSRAYLSGDRVDFMAKEYGGKLYVFAVNRNISTAASVRFDLSQFAPGAVSVYGENRTITPSGSSFSDTFQPYAVHIYEITPSGGTTPTVTNPTGTFTLNNGATSTNSPSVTANSSVTNATQMRFDTGSGYGVWIPYTASYGLTLPSGDGAKTISAQYTNASGGTLTLSDTITLSTVVAAPSGTMVVDKGVGSVTDPLATVDSNVTGATDMRIDPGTGTYGSWMPYNATQIVTMPSGNGTKTVRADYRNSVGATLSLSDTIDLNAPVVGPTGTMAVDKGVDVVSDPLATVDSNVTGATDMRIDPGTGTYGSWMAYNATQLVTMPAGDGTKTVRADYRDASGAVLSLSDTISVQGSTTAPAPAPAPAPLLGTMTINSDAAYTMSTSVGAYSAVPGATQMRFDTGSGFGSWLPYSSVYTLALPAGDGTKTVNAEYKDGSGGSLAVSDTIILDATAPTGTFSINSGANTTKTVNVTATSTISGATEMRFNTGSGYSAWVPYSATYSLTLPSGNGWKTVYAQYRDAAGNVKSATDTIKLFGGTTKLAAGSAFTRTQTVALTSSVGGAVQMRVDTGTGYSTWSPYASTKQVRLPFPVGPKTATVQYVDSDGVTLTLRDSIMLDTVAPVGTFVLNHSARYTSSRLVYANASVRGASKMRIRTGASYGPWIRYSATRYVWLPAGLGVKKVSIQYRDAAGNIATHADTIYRR